MAMLESIERYNHLGTEFLTWLWWKSEKNNGAISLDGFDDLEVHIADQLLMESSMGLASQVQLKGDSPAISPESRTALAENKQVRKCKLRVHLDGADWQATLDAHTLAFSSIRVPAPPGLGFDENVTLRLQLIERFQEAFFALFEDFLVRRLDEGAWKSEVQYMQDWISQK